MRTGTSPEQRRLDEVDRGGGRGPIPSRSIRIAFDWPSRRWTGSLRREIFSEKSPWSSRCNSHAPTENRSASRPTTIFETERFAGLVRRPHRRSRSRSGQPLVTSSTPARRRGSSGHCRRWETVISPSPPRSRRGTSFSLLICASLPWRREWSSNSWPEVGCCPTWSSSPTGGTRAGVRSSIGTTAVGFKRWRGLSQPR